MTSGEIAVLKEALVTTRAALLSVIAGVTEQQFKQRPSPVNGEASWSIAEVLAHLLWSERLRGERVRIALEADGSVITPSPLEAHEAAARSGRLAPVPQLIHGLLASRRELERLLDEAAQIDGGLERSVIHPVLGRQTIAWMVSEKVSAHEAEHVAQIEALRAAVGAGDTGVRGQDIGHRSRPERGESEEHPEARRKSRGSGGAAHARGSGGVPPDSFL